MKDTGAKSRIAMPVMPPVGKTVRDRCKPRYRAEPEYPPFGTACQCVPNSRCIASGDHTYAVYKLTRPTVTFAGALPRAGTNETRSCVGFHPGNVDMCA